MDNVDDAVRRLRAQIGAIEDTLLGLKEELVYAERCRTGTVAKVGKGFLFIPLWTITLELAPFLENLRLERLRGARFASAVWCLVSKHYYLRLTNKIVAHCGLTFQSNNPSYETSITRSLEVQNDQTPLLDVEEYKRYGRQMILPEVGLNGQVRLKHTSVLIVGLGGLGCPAAAYLAGAGVGKIGLVDGDTVELSNLHRQILHSAETIGSLKVESAQSRLKGINSRVQFAAHSFPLAACNAIDLFKQYDVILDCTDHPTSRYLVSDAAVLASRPLVSASALKTEGQLMVLNNPSSNNSTSSSNTHCYRCIFPKPPPPESITTCGEGGILGPVVGVMGVLMATEVIKLLLEAPKNEEDTSQTPPAKPTMLLYSAFSDQRFRTIRLGGRRQDCPSCSSKRTITEESLRSGSLDYVAFCGGRSSPNCLAAHQRISATDYRDVRSASAERHLLIDVREKTQFDLAHLTGSVNIPLYDIQNEPLESIQKIRGAKGTLPGSSDDTPTYFICRFGNDSQLAVHQLCDRNESLQARDICGGLDAWRRQVDPGFPEY